jgi:hypothetical protein
MNCANQWAKKRFMVTMHPSAYLLGASMEIYPKLMTP